MCVCVCVYIYIYMENITQTHTYIFSQIPKIIASDFKHVLNVGSPYLTELMRCGLWCSYNMMLHVGEKWGTYHITT